MHKDLSEKVVEGYFYLTLPEVLMRLLYYAPSGLTISNIVSEGRPRQSKVIYKGELQFTFNYLNDLQRKLTIGELIRNGLVEFPNTSETSFPSPKWASPPNQATLSASPMNADNSVKCETPKADVLSLIGSDAFQCWLMLDRAMSTAIVGLKEIFDTTLLKLNPNWIEREQTQAARQLANAYMDIIQKAAKDVRTLVTSPHRFNSEGQAIGESQKNPSQEEALPLAY